ncbi:MAG: flagellar biosynthesis protein FlhF [Bacillota bacterium]|nr:flagellar biosynthesis protein FlhF [Bacillota bacterium]
MRIRRYVATSLPEAVAQVRKDLGPEAMILEVRRVRAPGLRGWFGRRRVEVTAVAAERPSPAPVAGGSLSAAAPPAVAPAHPPAQRAAPVTAAPPEELLPERWRRASSLAREQVERLVEQGVRLALARTLVERALAELPEGELGDGQALSAGVRREILRLFPARPADPLAGRIFAFVGPTGVGKTTTIAKLAAVYSLQKAKRVALVTADTYRIAAVEQLKRYAEILRLPLEVVFTPEDLPAALARQKEADLILVDTAGRSPAQGMHLAELRSFLARCPEVQTVLVLSATTKSADLDQVFERFSALAPDQLVFTKLDETTSAGSLLNLIERARMPVGYVTNGQNVPDDLELARPERLAELILGGNSRA